MTEAILILSISNTLLGLLAAWQRHITVTEVRRKRAKRERKSDAAR